jgi:glycerol-3-phosphate dehydrogenase (NAD(P)+)
VAMPIVAAVYRLLQGAPPREVVAELLARPLTTEGPAA